MAGVPTAPPPAAAILESLDNAHVGFVLTMRDDAGVTRYAFVSRTACAILGRTAEELTGQPVTHWIAPEHLPLVAELMERRSRGESLPGTVEIAVLRPDGSRVTVEAGLSLLVIDGRLATTATMVDVTERKRFEAALAASEARFRNLVESAPEAIGVVRDMHFIVCNPALVALFGYEAERLRALHLMELVHPDDLEMLGERVRRTARGERTPPQEFRIRHGSGVYKAIELSSILIDFDGAPAVLGIVRDVSERRLLLAQLQQADRMATVGTVAAGVAHEINNPLTYVTLNLDGLGRELPHLTGDEARLQRAARLLEEAVAGVHRMSAIVRDLRTFSRSDAGDSHPVDVRGVLTSVINIAQHELRQRARVVTQFDEVPLVEANESRLSQVFLNLIVNAAQAIPEGAPDRHTVRVSTRRDAAGRLVVEVADTGGGIDASIRPFIFDPFFSTKPAGVGTGLGLFICQSIVSRLGGEITIESTVGRGTSVSVALPPRAPTSGGRSRSAT